MSEALPDPTTLPMEELLPHRPPMLLLDRVVEVREEGMRCAAVVQADAVFVRGDRLGRCALVEYLAQTMAALVGWQGRVAGGDEVRRGYLVAARGVEFSGGPVNVGDELVVDVVQEAALGDYGSYRGEVRLRGEVVCRGNLKVMRGGEA